MSAIKNIFHNGGVEPVHRQMQKQDYGVMIITCLFEADNPSKEAVQYAAKLGFRMRKTLSDQSVTASSIVREIVEGNTNYIRYICDCVSGGTNSNVTLSYGYGPTTSVMIRYDESQDDDDDECFVGRLLLLIVLPENEMTSVIPPQDPIFHQIQACSTFPPEVYISPSTKIWDSSLLGNHREQLKDLGKTIVLKINKEDEIYSVESTPGSSLFAAKKVEAETKSTTTTTVAVEEPVIAEKISVSDSSDVEPSIQVTSSKRKGSDVAAKAKPSPKKARVVSKKKDSGKAVIEVAPPPSPKASKAKADASLDIAGEEVTNAKRPSRVLPKSPKKHHQPPPSQSPKKTVKPKETEVQVEKDENKTKVQTPKNKKSKAKKSKAESDKSSTIPEDQPKVSKQQGKKPLVQVQTVGNKDGDGKEPAEKKSKGKSTPKKMASTALSPYAIFCQEQRQGVMDIHPDKKPDEIAMILGNMFNGLPQKKLAIYLAKAEEQSKVVDNDVVPEEGADVEPDKKHKKTSKGDTGKKKQKKDPNAPRKPNSAYMYFCFEKRAQIVKDNPSISVPESGKILGKMWREIKDKEKEKFNKLAAKDKKRYEEAMKSYNPESGH